MGSRGDESVFKMWKLEKGMMTVEASCLLPIVFFVLILIIYFFFYCYESGTAEGILRQEVLKLSDVMKTSGNIDDGEYSIDLLNQRKLTYLLNITNKEMETKCKSNIKTKLAQKSMFGSGTKITIQISNNTIHGTVTSNVKIPLLGSVEIGGFSLFTVNQEVTTQVRIPAEQIRRWQQIE